MKKVVALIFALFISGPLVNGATKSNLPGIEARKWTRHTIIVTSVNTYPCNIEWELYQLDGDWRDWARGQFQEMKLVGTEPHLLIMRVGGGRVSRGGTSSNCGVRPIMRKITLTDSSELKIEQYDTRNFAG